MCYVAVVCLGVSGCSNPQASSSVDRKSSAEAKVQPSPTRFPDAHEAPPAGWAGPVFKLRQDYPTSLPPAESLPWANIDPKTDGMKYAKAVLAYAFDGNVGVDWVVQKNTKRAWYHAPWMHSGNSGREFIHGMTRERTSRPKELAPTQVSQFQNWAVGFYNAPGGYTIGQVWKNHSVPNPAAAVFPPGTVSVKLLFTAATIAEVPYLKNAFEWDANINQPMTSTTRKPGKMRLLQIDIGVRDTRADSTTGWVFGTFTYDGNATGATPWDRMIPVGVMWGNDPGVLPNTTKLVETIINPGLNVPQHLGWGGRLNGPVDNPMSSCLSCHSLAEYQQTTPMLPPANATPAQRLAWFKNVKAGQPFDAGETSLDYSLQLSSGITNCVGANKCTIPGTSSPTALTKKSAGPATAKKAKIVYKPTRG
jgi:hypothetical protein